MNFFSFFSCCSKREKVQNYDNPIQQQDIEQMNNEHALEYYFNSQRQVQPNKNDNNTPSSIYDYTGQKQIEKNDTLSSIYQYPQQKQTELQDRLFNTDQFILGNEDFQEQQYVINENMAMKEEYISEQSRQRSNKSYSSKKSVSSNLQIKNEDQIQKKIHKVVSRQIVKRNVKLWTQEEDELLKKYQIEFNGNWEKITQMISGRNISQCSQRWRRMNQNNNSTKLKWTEQENQEVLNLVSKYGKNWGFIAKKLKRWNGKQIRERYLNILDPNLRQDKWTQEEDDLILKYYQIWGTRWSKISAQLKGRSENKVKNRFYTHIKRVMLGEKNKYQIVFNQDSKSQSKIIEETFNETFNENDIDNDMEESSSQLSEDRYNLSFDMKNLDVVMSDEMDQQFFQI